MVGDINCRDFCVLSNIMGLNGALTVVFIVPKNTKPDFWKETFFRTLCAMLQGFMSAFVMNHITKLSITPVISDI